ncbi:MAG: TetR/AcrR family transcriptional regulator C-terminal domain-containing protein [Erysipelotrichaceae bacterium]|jgi:AcrR family transcriptional regulator|nr:TetR/AcrR family transcriptional regulator C-terminal domain-containing protein [Erysipelotrichaceae bacterium]
MKTEYRLAEALKALLAEDNALDDISVTKLVQKCKVNRQTFYYHFHDIYDLLTLVYLNEKISNIERSQNVREMLKHIYDYYKKNKKFIKGTLSSAGRDLFSEFIYNNCYQILSKLLLEIDESNELSDYEKKDIVRFTSAGFSYQIVFYFANFRNPSLEGLYNIFLSLPEDFLKKATNNVLLKRKTK